MSARISRRTRLFGCVLAFALAATACGGDDGTETTTGETSGDLSGTIKIDGSSTVAPLSEAAAELFQAENPNVRVTVGTSGTGGGFQKFCNGETDISDASRPIKQTEIDACAAKGIRYDAITVANDGLSVVVSPENSWAKCLTVEQLKKVWAPDSTVANWKDVDPSFPDEKLTLFGAGTDSGTFDYFTEAINGKEGASRTDYNATEDDNVTINGVSGTRGGMGYLGLSYVEQNPGKVKPLEIDGGGGCVAPAIKTVQDETYKPLARPLFIYPTAAALARPEVQAFLRFYIENSDDIAEQALFVPMTDTERAESNAKIQALSGT
ncbi:MAG TPA: PstS family phosphate ABC transporter substrate-binding protein [Acidimicrobiales bacterium]|nr:PstS family phosphate ABC transporter substrate-binding protein [Acidimicrobiales bacterium]